MSDYYKTSEGYDEINHPPHYMGHPSGIECIQITEYMGFNLGNAVKYIWRADLKDHALEDLRKAEWYIRREIMRREAMDAPVQCPPGDMETPQQGQGSYLDKTEAGQRASKEYTQRLVQQQYMGRSNLRSPDEFPHYE